MLKEDGKYYVIMRAEHAGSVAEHLKDEELKFGPVLMKKRHPVLMDYLKKEKDTCEKIKKNLADNAGESARSKIDEFEKKEALLDGVLGKLMEV
jgi:tRNA (adenine22-N1)-methyltransferase